MGEQCEIPMEQADRRWVRQYAIVLQVGAALVVLVALVYFVLGMIDLTRGTSPAFTKLYFVFMVANMLAYAMVPLVLSHLLRYVFGQRQTPGRLLRNGACAFFGLAAVQLLAHVSSAVFFSQVPQYTWWRLLLISPQTLVGILVWVALGLVLRRILPIIEESKTLV